MTRSEAWQRIYDLQRRGKAKDAQREIDASGSNLSEVERADCIGTQFFLQRDFQRAVNHYETAITLDPSFTIARYQYLVGVQEERENNFVAAFKRYQNAIEIDPQFADAYTELGGLLMKVKDFEGAAQCFTDALRVEPDQLGNYQNVVAVFQQLAQQDRAKYEQSLRAAEEQYADAKRRLSSVPAGHSW